MKGENWYADFVNPNVYIDKMLHSENGKYIPFRYVLGIINAKISLFEYENLPNKLTPTILELSLLFCNRLCFYYYGGTKEWLLCRYVPNSERNYYYLPDTVNIIALNGVTLATDVSYDDLILVKDNRMDIMPFLSIKEYIDKLYYLERQEDKIINLACFPIAFCGNKKQANQMRELAKKSGNGTAYVIGDDSITDNVKSFDINVPISPTEVHEVREHWRRECLSSLGIYSADEKRERIVTAEITATNDFTDYCYQSAKLSRQQFCDEYNKRTNGNMKLIEVYDINYNEDSVLQGNRERKMAEADSINKGNKQNVSNSTV